MSRRRYPESWGFVAGRGSVGRMELIEGTWTDEEIGAWCDDRGRICVAEASCPHLGPTVGGAVTGRLPLPRYPVRQDRTMRRRADPGGAGLTSRGLTDQTGGTRGREAPAPRRVAIVGGGISGLGAAWALNRHPDRFDFLLFEAQDRIGGNAVTADMPQDGGGAIPFDISVTACIPSVYRHMLLLMERFGIDLIDTRFSYSVKYRGGVYAHDFDSDIRDQLQPEIARFQRILRRLHWFGWLSRSQSKLLNALNPFNYVSMGTLLNLAGFSGDFRYKVLKPMFVNFLMATNVFDMPTALFARYLEFFDIETCHAHADVGPGDEAHLREPVRRFPGQDPPQPTSPEGVPPEVPRRGRGRERCNGDV